MFLSPVAPAADPPQPPRTTRSCSCCGRSALALLALAFARPFLRQDAPARPRRRRAERRVAVLIDTSASMRRGDLWAQALGRRPTRPSPTAGPTDQRGGLRLRRARRARCWASTSRRRSTRRSRQAVARGRSSTACRRPGAATRPRPGADRRRRGDRGRGGRRRQGVGAKRRIVLVSDLQQGSRLDALADFEWPTDVELDLQDGRRRRAATPASTWLADRVEDDRPRSEAGPLRVRVTNDAELRRRSEFALAWVDGERPAAAPIDAYVPPGESRVVRVPRPPATGRSDRSGSRATPTTSTTRLYLAAPPREEATVLYVGPDAPRRPQRPALLPRPRLRATPRAGVDPRRRPEAAEAVAWDDARSAAARRGDRRPRPRTPPSSGDSSQDGGTVLVVVTRPGRPTTLAALAGRPRRGRSRRRRVDARRDARRDRLRPPALRPARRPAVQRLHEDPLLEASAHRPTRRLGDARVLARFEDGDPAVIEKTVGQGPARRPGQRLAPRRQPARAVVEVRAPDDGPAGAAELRRGPLTASFLVGDRVPLPTAEGRRNRRRPQAGRLDRRRSTGEPRPSPGPTHPGVYVDRHVRPARGRSPSTSTRRRARRAAAGRDAGAVRLPPGEELARGRGRPREPQRQMQNAELEGRQKLWRPADPGGDRRSCIVETWLAGWLGRTRPTGPERRGAPVSHEHVELASRRWNGSARRVRPGAPLGEAWPLCWSAWALIGLRSASPRSGRGPSLARVGRGVSVGPGATGCRRSGRCAPALVAAPTARDPRWVARRIEAKHPELAALLLTAVEQDIAASRPASASSRTRWSRQAARPRPHARLGRGGPPAAACSASPRRPRRRPGRAWSSRSSRPSARGPGPARRRSRDGLVATGLADVAGRTRRHRDRTRHVAPGRRPLRRGGPARGEARRRRRKRDLVARDDAEPRRPDVRRPRPSRSTPTSRTASSSAAGRARRTASRVFEHPELMRTDAEARLPRATPSLEPKTVEDIRHVTAVEGTEVTLLCRLNKEVAAAEPGRREGAGDRRSPPHDAANARLQRDAHAHRVPALQGPARRRATGGRTSSPPTLGVNVTRNRPPTVADAPARPRRRASRRWRSCRLKADLKDDFGLARHGVSVRHGGPGPPREIVLSDGTAKPRPSRPRPTT